MGILKAFLTGIRGVNRSKRYILLVYLINLVVAVVFNLTGVNFIQVIFVDANHNRDTEVMTNVDDSIQVMHSR